ncbi:MAG: YihY/virulence factor BrkB family protein [Bradyrhizobium sp.]
MRQKAAAVPKMGGDEQGRASRPIVHPSLWAVAVTVALLAVALLAAGFRPQMSSPRSSDPSDSHSGPRERSAKTPSDRVTRGNPLTRGKEILLRLYTNISDHHIFTLAAGMTFYTLLAIFPALAALVAIYGFFSNPAAISAHVDTLSGILPGGAIEIARNQLTRVASKGEQTLGVAFVLGLAVSLWSANNATKSLFDTLNVIHGETEKRSFISLNAISLLFTGGAIVFALLAIAAVIVLPVALRHLGSSEAADTIVRIARWPALFVVLALVLALIYRYGPSRETQRWRWITWGSASASMLWLAASVLFSWYTANFGSYNATYGSLGAVIGFMTWLWISATVVLLGAELDAEMERQRTAIDVKSGVSRPHAIR